eukprot:gene10036-20898_t
MTDNMSHYNSLGDDIPTQTDENVVPRNTNRRREKISGITDKFENKKSTALEKTSKNAVNDTSTNSTRIKTLHSQEIVPTSNPKKLKVRKFPLEEILINYSNMASAKDTKKTFLSSVEIAAAQVMETETDNPLHKLADIEEGESCGSVTTNTTDDMTGTSDKNIPAFIQTTDGLCPCVQRNKYIKRMEEEISELRCRLDTLDHRHALDDKGKKFDSSWTRVLIIMAITYVSLSNYMHLIGVGDPLRGAVVPTIGFYLSTWSLCFMRKLWIRWYDWNWGHPRQNNIGISKSFMSE